MSPPNFSLVNVSQLLLFSVSTMAALIFSPTSSQATSLKQDYLSDSTIIARDRLISRGITAYDAGYYDSAVYLLRNFLNRHKFIRTPLEQAGINYLALAYQATGDEIQARETILRGISAKNEVSLERANLEYTAGLIALQQQKMAIANQHWHTARRLYLIKGDRQKWRELTFSLIKNYKKLGESSKAKQLWSELGRSTKD